MWERITADILHLCRYLRLMELIMVKILEFFKRIKLFFIGLFNKKVYYVSGGETLPAPLDAETEQEMIEHIEEQRAMQGLPKMQIGVLGLSFKAGTDDMRNSPIVNVIEALHGKGYDIRIYDKNVCLSRLIGRNKSVIASKLPHLNQMLQEDMAMVTEWADCIIIANKDSEYAQARVAIGMPIIDLVRIKELEGKEGYNGLCW